MTDVDVEEALRGPPEVVIPLAVEHTAASMMSSDVVVLSFVLAAFRGSDGHVRVAKSAVSESHDGLRRLAKTLRHIADEIDAGEYDTEIRVPSQNAPGGSN